MDNDLSFQQLIIENINLNELSQNKVQELKCRLQQKLIELTKCNADLNKQITGIDKTKFKFEEINIPPFADYYKRLELGYLIPENRHRRQWHPKDKKLLVNGIRQEIIQKRTQIANEEFRNVLNELKNLDFKQNLIEQVADLRAKYERMSLADLVQDEDEDGLDWTQIADKYLNGLHSGQECRNMWNSYLHPKFNKLPWTEQEETQLKKLVQKFRRQNWSAIANELNTGRSEFQCFEKYLKLKKSTPWTNEEDKRLLHLIEQFRSNHFIYWPTVTAHMHNRTRIQVYKRWRILADEEKMCKNNSFTVAEDLTLLAAARIVGDGLNKLAKYLPHRKFSQIRSHWNRLRRIALPTHFSQMDFQDLWLLMKKYSPTNPRIYRHFHYLRFYQLKSRIRFLETKFKEENFQIKDIKIRSKKPTKRFYQKLEQARELARKSCPSQLFKKISTYLKEDKRKYSTILNNEKPRGRPSNKKDPLNRNLLEFFRMTYHQAKGRNKHNFTDEEYSRLNNSTNMWSQLLNVQFIPNKFSESSTDNGLDEYLWKTCADTSASRVDGANRIHFAPPTLSSLVGLRTLLLSQRTFCHNFVPTEFSSTQMSNAAIQAKERFMRRMLIIFLGPFFLSKSYTNLNIQNKEQTPAIEFPVETTTVAETEREDQKKMKKRPGKKRPVPMAALEARRLKFQKKPEETTSSELDEIQPPKRKYNKTGKYKKKKIPIDDTTEIRRSCRNSSKNNDD